MIVFFEKRTNIFKLFIYYTTRFEEDLSSNITNNNKTDKKIKIWDALHDLVLFVQFKNLKNNHGRVLQCSGELRYRNKEGKDFQKEKQIQIGKSRGY